MGRSPRHLLTKEKHMLSKLLKSIFIASGLIAANAVFAESDNIIGKYNCSGNDPTITPSAFIGNITITKQANGAYLIAETDNAGGIYQYNQLGLRDGDSLAMAFQLANKPSVFAVQHMKIEKQGKVLQGTFAYWNIPDKTGTETCTKVK